MVTCVVKVYWAWCGAAGASRITFQGSTVGKCERVAGERTQGNSGMCHIYIMWCNACKISQSVSVSVLCLTVVVRPLRSVMRTNKLPCDTALYNRIQRTNLGTQAYNCNQRYQSINQSNLVFVKRRLNKVLRGAYNAPDLCFIIISSLGDSVA